jgi:hypothetical protein
MQTSSLPYRTPAEYLARAKRLQRDGSPDAQRAMRAAALAYATAHAAERGDQALAARGLAGLRAIALSDAAGGTGDLDSVLRGLRANPQVRQYVSLVSGLVELANGIIAIIVQMTGNASDPGVAQALGWMRFITGSSATPPGLSDSDIRGLASFVQSTAFLDNADVVEGIAAAARGVGGLIDYFTRSNTASQAIQVVMAVVSFFRLFRSKLSENVRIRAILDAAPAGNAQSEPVERCFATLNCPGTGQLRRVTADGSGCECYTPTVAERQQTPAQLAARARQQWQAAMAGRYMIEEGLRRRLTTPLNLGLVVIPTFERAQRLNCQFSCTLRFAENQLLTAQRAAGQTPMIPAYTTIAPSSTVARGWIDASTAPSSCDCRNMTLLLPGGPVFPSDMDTGGGGSASTAAVAVGGAAAVGLLFYFFR